MILEDRYRASSRRLLLHRDEIGLTGVFFLRFTFYVLRHYFPSNLTVPSQTDVSGFVRSRSILCK